MNAYIKAISYFLPATAVSNQQLQTENPDWDMARVAAKTGIDCRHIAGADETASDLAFGAASKLLSGAGIERSAIDFLLFCTQSPDYALPASACILQDRLGLSQGCGALDFNQGCSGYIYGLYLASAMVRAGMAHNVLLLTGETYSKYIHPRDRSVRVLFGDAGTATLVTAEAGGASILDGCLGTDGGGAANLMVPISGARNPRHGIAPEVTDAAGCVRTGENLFMDGQELFGFTLKRVPALIQDTLQKNRMSAEDVRMYVFHQANAFMNEHLRKKAKIPCEKAPLCMEDVGNTVSNTIPLTLCRSAHELVTGDKVMLVGFGVGYSWGSCVLSWGDVALPNG